MKNNDILVNKPSISSIFLLGFAGFCLAIALVIAWVLGITLFFPDGGLASHIVERSDIIKAHIDYLMMAQFLLIFFVLFRQFAIDPPAWLVGACSFGAFFNPLAFLKRGLTAKPEVMVAVEPHFPLLAAISFSLITVGFLAAVWLVLRAAWQRRNAGGGLGSTLKNN